MRNIVRLFFVFLMSTILYSQTGGVFHAKIEGEIDLGLTPYIKRVIKDAENAGAKAIIFEINTFGGRVDAATQIKDAILESKVLTIAYINKRAISAGALIALSCKKIVMVKGSSMGATTVVDQTGEKQSEKYQSYMRSEMRSTAERNGRRTDIAEGMVDERIVVEGLVDSTQLITLTSDEARKFGYADTVVSSFVEMLKAYNLDERVVTVTETNWAEDFVRFLGNPIVSSLLMMIGMIGMYTEIKTPGWGVAGTVALIAFALFFGSAVILELASMLEILIFIFGVILLLVEIFVIPGFGIAGIGGILLIVISLFLALIDTTFYFDTELIFVAIIQLAAALGGGLIIIAMLLKYLPKSSTFHQFILDDATSRSEGFVSNPEHSELTGEEGEALTDLRPSGIVVIKSKRYDVVTEGDYIQKGSRIKVSRVEGVKIIVQKM
ncbi:MAG: nodulation protein NfeD [Ignavibacteriales bacterium]|jgi:membrane-bound serine protease (ClpP class)|nr:NfeD family protein [Ignavibacteriaceae bacterium]NLH60945.1 nodulation protein NfeD [Ignavibacteriales bacterium]HOJ18891.1 NfeD family protein [Ignavibacteriaceae bacterium]HPO56869.1 NfeD family protein [Ignavibacteriaceae bacterium]